MAAPPIAEPEVLTEVPTALKRLVRYIVRGFYEVEHALVIDLLVHHPCIKEEDLLDLLKIEQKQLRTVINTLKNDKFIKVRMRMETNAENRTNKHNYYFINYSTFVNVVKYKLHHIQRKIETEERNMTSRASFMCPGCKKTFTDLEAGQLFDPAYGEMRCTYCQTEVEEDASVLPKTDARTLMVKFNEQMEPIFSLLREVEDVKLSQDLLEPEPVSIGSKNRVPGSKPGDTTIWSGERRNETFGASASGVTICVEGEEQQAASMAAPVKEQPVWMAQSTIKGAMADAAITETITPGRVDEQATRSLETNDIMRTLLAHEKKAPAPVIPGQPRQSDDSSSDSEIETAFKPQTFKPQTQAVAAAETMESDDDEEDVAMVTVGGISVSYHEVTEDMIQRMNQAEKDAYIKMGQEMYEDMYD